MTATIAQPTVPATPGASEPSRATRQSESWPFESMDAAAQAGHESVATAQPGTVTQPLDLERLHHAKEAYTTRFVVPHLERTGQELTLLTGADVRPRAGQVVLARIVTLGQHSKLPDSGGRRATLYPGDEVLLAYGDRYAPDQFDARVPDSLAVTNLAAAGGLAAEVVGRHGSMRDATVVEPLGLVADTAGTPLTLADCAPHAVRPAAEVDDTDLPPVLYVVGSSMNAGKTTTVAQLVRGLAHSGLRVAAGKATGTGAWGDPGLFKDSGAEKVLDFTDFGHPSTFLLDPGTIRDLVASVRADLAADRPDVVVIEIADGLYQRETSALLSEGGLDEHAHGVVLCVGEALGAVAGVSVLRSCGLPVTGVTGAVTASPMASREAASVLDVPMVGTFKLSDPETVRDFVGF
ncbi:DUF1611 domain-containing protein [Kytococcus sp. Marseille-QA3725]